MIRSNRRLSTVTQASATEGSTSSSGGGQSPGSAREPVVHGAAHQFAQDHLLQGDVDRPGVGTRDLEQLVDHALEPAEVGPEEHQCPLGRLVELLAVGLEHGQGVGEGGEGGAQLVADVGGEPLLSLDALLELVDHGVEGAGEADQVGVVDGSRQPGVELGPGDGAAADTPVSGRRARPAAERPTTAPRAVVMSPAAKRARARTRRVLLRSFRSKTSK